MFDVRFYEVNILSSYSILRLAFHTLSICSKLIHSDSAADERNCVDRLRRWPGEHCDISWAVFNNEHGSLQQQQLLTPHYFLSVGFTCRYLLRF